MKIKIIIATFLMSAQFHNLNAMGDSKKTLEKLAEIAADSKEHGEAQSAQSAAAAVSLDNKNKKEVEIVKAADPVTQAMYEAIIKQEHQIKFNAFYAVFKDKANEFWHLWGYNEKHQITIAYMETHHEGILRFKESYDKQVAKDADKIQSKIDEHFKKKYAQIYQEVYKQHYNVQAPAVIAARAACLVYDQQNSCCPCTIL